MRGADDAGAAAAGVAAGVPVLFPCLEIPNAASLSFILRSASALIHADRSSGVRNCE